MVTTTPSAPAQRDGLARWQAIVGTIVGAVLAQGGSLAFVMIGLLGLMAYHGKSTVNVQQLPGGAFVLTASALAASVFLLAVSVLTPTLARVPVRKALGLVGAPFWTYPAAVLGALALGPIGGVVHSLVKKAAPNLTLGTVDFLNDFASGHAAWVVWPLLAVMPALCEEIFFRGMLQRALGATPVAIIVSGVAFAVFHLDPHHVAAVLPVGLHMAWLAAKTGSTFVPITAHLTNNTLAVLALQLQPKAEASEPVPLWLVPPAIAAWALSVALVVWAMRRAKPAPLAGAAGERQ
jgi:membrane protease YdiL (CAAX protease family)